MPVYRDYDQAALDRQYDQRTLVPEIDVYLQRYRRESARVRGRLHGRLDVRYGPSEDEVLDIFPAERPTAPVQLFIHGGAWTREHKDGYSFVAERFVAAGAAVVIVNFGLVPQVTLDELVRQNRAALAWAWRNAAHFGGDPDRLFVSGHSSGGHVAAMLLAAGWQHGHALPADVIKGATLLSGVYDLEPVRLSARNAYLRLNSAAAALNSPIRHLPDHPVPLIVGYGGGELDEFKRQSRAFAAAWRDRGHPCREIECAGLNHFQVALELAKPGSPVLTAMLEQMGLSAIAPEIREEK